MLPQYLHTAAAQRSRAQHFGPGMAWSDRLMLPQCLPSGLRHSTARQQPAFQAPIQAHHPLLVMPQYGRSDSRLMQNFKFVTWAYET